MLYSRKCNDMFLQEMLITSERLIKMILTVELRRDDKVKSVVRQLEKHFNQRHILW